MRAGLVGRPRAKSTGYQRPCRMKAVNGQGSWYETGTVDHVPDREIADLDAAVVQLGQQLAERQIRLLRDPFENAIALTGQGKGPMTSHRLSRQITLFSIQPRPSLHGGLADFEERRRPEPAHAGAERCDDPFSQIQGEGASIDAGLQPTQHPGSDFRRAGIYLTQAST